jgi:hypothetical protein
MEIRTYPAFSFGRGGLVGIGPLLLRHLLRTEGTLTDTRLVHTWK